jgi:acetyl-CoA acetyltransferase
VEGERADQDAWALGSQQKAARGWRDGAFDEQIVPSGGAGELERDGEEVETRRSRATSCRARTTPKGSPSSSRRSRRTAP